MGIVPTRLPEQPVSLPVSVVCAAGSRAIEVSWRSPARTSAFAHFRIFLSAPDGSRTYLAVVDAGDHAVIEVPDSVGDAYLDGCTVEVETYSSGSWGGGRLTGVGRSEPFQLG